MKKILGLGNALVDVLVHIDNDSVLLELELPKGGMTWVDDEKFAKMQVLLNDKERVMAAGGSTANTTKALGKLGVPAFFLGTIGHDEFGRFYANELEKAHVKPILLKSDEHTGICTAFITNDGERTFGNSMGAALKIKASDLTDELFTGYDYVYIEGYLISDPDYVLRAAHLAKEHGAKVIFDLASYTVVKQHIDFLRIFLSGYVDIVFANKEEALALTGKQPMEAAEELGVLCRIAIVKTGKEGAILRDGEGSIVVPASDVPKVIDTTGAGDYYSAGFIYGLQQGCSLETCGKIASILSGYIIQTIGPTLDEQVWEDIKKDINNVLHS